MKQNGEKKISVGFATAGGTKLKEPSKEAMQKATEFLNKTPKNTKKIALNNPNVKTPETPQTPLKNKNCAKTTTPSKKTKQLETPPTTQRTQPVSKKETKDCSKVPKKTTDKEPNELPSKEKMVTDFQKNIHPHKPPSQKWIETHLEQIIWKTRSIECKFPKKFPFYCNSRTIQKELLHRYEREILKGERSAIKKIVERDDFPSRHLVLFVFSIKNKEIELSDGWYVVRTETDRHIKELVETEKIKVGQKLHLFGSKLISDKAVDVLSKNSRVCLSIKINSTRPAMWNQRLGFQKERLFSVSLQSIYQDGGIIPQLHVKIEEIYPILCYISKHRKGCFYTENEMQLVTGLEEDSEVTSVLRVKVSCIRKETSPAILSVWKPNAELIEDFLVGTVLSISGLRPDKKRNNRQGLVFIHRPLWKVIEKPKDTPQTKQASLEEGALLCQKEVSLYLLVLFQITITEKQFYFFACDEACRIARIDFPPWFKSSNKILPKKDKSYLFRNLIGKIFDKKNQIVTLSHTDLSSFTNKALSIEEKNQFRKLDDLKQKTEFKDAISKINSLL